MRRVSWIPCSCPMASPWPDFLGIRFKDVRQHFLKGDFAGPGSAEPWEVTPPLPFRVHELESPWALVALEMGENGLSLKTQTAEKVGYNTQRELRERERDTERERDG